MQLFLKKILYYTCFAVIIFLVALILSSALAKNKASKRGRGVVIDKVNLLKQTLSPKIIFIGGSNVCYGLNAQLIEDSLKIPVVDMSINADVGMVFYMNQLKPFLNKGDIVVGIPEYASYSNKVIYGNESLYGLCTVMPENATVLTPYQWLRVFKFGGDILRDNYTAFVADKNSIISNGRKLYNKWGDYVGHENKIAIIDTVLAVKTAKQNFLASDSYFKQVVSFNKFCKENGITYLHSYPVYMRSLYNDSWEQKIQQNLTGINIINKPTDFLYGVDSLFDSENHLRFQFRNQRSIKLLNNLRNQLASKK